MGLPGSFRGVKRGFVTDTGFAGKTRGWLGSFGRGRFAVVPRAAARCRARWPGWGGLGGAGRRGPSWYGISRGRSDDPSMDRTTVLATRCGRGRALPIVSDLQGRLPDGGGGAAPGPEPERSEVGRFGRGRRWVGWMVGCGGWRCRCRSPAEERREDPERKLRRLRRRFAKVTGRLERLDRLRWMGARGRGGGAAAPGGRADRRCRCRGPDRGSIPVAYRPMAYLRERPGRSA